MPRTLNLTGFQTGDNLNLSVSQGALTAGPVNILSWGGAPSGGTVTINVDRTNLQVAPDSVRFTVDLSESSFDTAGPGEGEVYDARMHDLIFLWDFDDASAGDWTAPENVLPAWKNRNVAKGPFVAHMYTIPRAASLGAGNGYNPSVMVLEPSSGKVTTATATEFFVADPDTVYTDADTWYVNDTSDSDFSEVPVGVPSGNKIQTDYIDLTFVENNIETASGAPRLRVKKGNRITIGGFRADGGTPTGIYIDSYGGSGADPIIDAPTDDPAFGTSNYIFYVNNFHGASADLRIKGLDFRGTYNPLTEAVGDNPDFQVAIYLFEDMQLMVSDCSFKGLNVLSYFPQWTDDAGAHFDNCIIEEWTGQYAFITSSGTYGTDSTYFAMTGCRATAFPTGVNSSHGLVRLNNMPKAHLRGDDLFNVASTQGCLKMIETPSQDGHLVNMHSCSVEGGLYPIIVDGAGGGVGRSTDKNAIIDGFIVVGSFFTTYQILLRGPGVTVRNSLLIQPSIPKGSAPSAHFGFVALTEVGSPDATISGQPVKVYNNTCRSERAYGDNNNVQPQVLYDQSDFTSVTTANNIRHLPSGNPVVDTYADLTTTALFTPRYGGQRDAATLVLDDTVATPSDTVKDTKPDTGSPAIDGATTGDLAMFDINGYTKRDGNQPSTVDVGCWET